MATSTKAGPTPRAMSGSTLVAGTTTASGGPACAARVNTLRSVLSAAGDVAARMPCRRRHPTTALPIRNIPALTCTSRMNEYSDNIGTFLEAQRARTRRPAILTRHDRDMTVGDSTTVVGAIAVRIQIAAFRRLGLDPARIATEAGLSDSVLDDPDGMLPGSGFQTAWEIADRQWGRPALGLRAAETVPFGACEVMDYLMASSATVADALSELAAYLAVLTKVTRYEIHDRRDFPSCEMVWQAPPQGVMFHLRDFGLALVAAPHVFTSAANGPRASTQRSPAHERARVRPLLRRADRRTGRIAVRSSFRARPGRPGVPKHDETLNRMLRRHAELLLDRRRPASGRRSRIACRKRWSGARASA